MQALNDAISSVLFKLVDKRLFSSLLHMWCFSYDLLHQRTRGTTVSNRNEICGLQMKNKGTCPIHIVFMLQGTLYLAGSKL